MICLFFSFFLFLVLHISSCKPRVSVCVVTYGFVFDCALLLYLSVPLPLSEHVSWPTLYCNVLLIVLALRGWTGACRKSLSHVAPKRKQAVRYTTAGSAVSSCRAPCYSAQFIRPTQAMSLTTCVFLPSAHFPSIVISLMPYFIFVYLALHWQCYHVMYYHTLLLAEIIQIKSCAREIKKMLVL